MIVPYPYITGIVDQAKIMNNGSVDILASLKISSSRPIEVAKQPATIYWILPSNPLLKRFVSQVDSS